MGKKKSNQQHLQHFLSNVARTVDSLPTAAEKAEALKALEALVLYVQDLQVRIGSVPTAEDTQGLRRAFSVLEEFMARAKDSPSLAAALGLRPPRGVTRQTKEPSATDAVEAERALEQLKELSSEQMRTRLLREEFSMPTIRAIAFKCGVKSTAKLSREDLAHQITMKIANSKGYKMLRGSATEGNEEAPLSQEASLPPGSGQPS